MTIPTAQIANLAEKAPELTKLKKACDAMESSFLRQMLKVMRDTVQETDLGGDKTGADDFKSMADGAVADRLAERGTLDISHLTFQATARQVLNQRFQPNEKK